MSTPRKTAAKLDTVKNTAPVVVTGGADDPTTKYTLVLGGPETNGVKVTVEVTVPKFKNAPVEVRVLPADGALSRATSFNRKSDVHVKFTTV